MAQLPKFNKVQHLIEDGEIINVHRPYLGYSSLGSKCKRLSWYGFHWAFVKRISPRVKRLFERGDWEESVIKNDLENAGIVLHSAQLEVVGLAGHVRGHIDGMVENVPDFLDEPLLFEAKTMSNKNFQKYKKIGLKLFNPAYYHQVHSYMGKLGLTHALYIATNKDNEQRDYDIIEFNPDAFDEAESFAMFIITSEGPPPKIGPKTWHECKFCDAKPICHHGHPIEQNCRTCTYAAIEDDAKWSCDFHDGKTLSVEEQRKGCDDYVIMEELVD